MYYKLSSSIKTETYDKPIDIFDFAAGNLQVLLTVGIVSLMLLALLLVNIRIQLRQRRLMNDIQHEALFAKVSKKDHNLNMVPPLYNGTNSRATSLARNPLNILRSFTAVPHNLSSAGNSFTFNRRKQSIDELTIYNSEANLSIPLYLELEKTDFQIGKKLAKGGGGEVFLGRSKSSKTSDYGNQIVIKKIGEKYDSLTTKQKQSFDQEISIMTLLKNETSIAKIIGFCRDPCVIVMKYYEQGSLNQKLFSKVFKPFKSFIVIVLKDIASGLHVMHSKNLAHCDLKAHNVLVETISGKTRAFITDFGITNVLDSEIRSVKSFKLANSRGMTRMYAAPEAILRYRRKKPSQSEVTKAGDVFSFAMIIFELLHKSHPWPRRTGLRAFFESFFLMISPEKILSK